MIEPREIIFYHALRCVTLRRILLTYQLFSEENDKWVYVTEYEALLKRREVVSISFGTLSVKFCAYITSMGVTINFFEWVPFFFVPTSDGASLLSVLFMIGIWLVKNEARFYLLGPRPLFLLIKFKIWLLLTTALKYSVLYINSRLRPFLSIYFWPILGRFLGRFSKRTPQLMAGNYK